MTWQEISNNINRKIVESATPMVTSTNMVGLLNETYDELLEEWLRMASEKDEGSIQLLAPLLRPAIAIPLTGVIFYLDDTNFPGGCRWIASLRGAFTQTCSGASETRNIRFMSMNDVGDFENPLRKPDNDHPRYRVWYDPSTSKKKATIYGGSTGLPTQVDAFYYRNPAILSSIVGTPEVTVEGQYKIIKRAVDKLNGINLDERKPVSAAETNRDVQILLT